MLQKNIEIGFMNLVLVQNIIEELDENNNWLKVGKIAGKLDVRMILTIIVRISLDRVSCKFNLIFYGCLAGI
jgi:hypothetical protein